jgi:anti-sigma B factor antagonist
MTEARFAVAGPSVNNPPLVVVSGDIDLANVDEFQNAMHKAGNGSPVLHVDLTGVSYCDSAAVRALFALAATTDLTMIVKPNGHITTLLAISGLDRVATVVRRE